MPNSGVTCRDMQVSNVQTIPKVGSVEEAPKRVVWIWEWRSWDVLDALKSISGNLKTFSYYSEAHGYGSPETCK